jgi:hypothetical protein
LLGRAGLKEAQETSFRLEFFSPHFNSEPFGRRLPLGTQTAAYALGSTKFASLFPKDWFSALCVTRSRAWQSISIMIHFLCTYLVTAFSNEHALETTPPFSTVMPHVVGECVNRCQLLGGHYRIKDFDTRVLFREASNRYFDSP